MSQPDSSGGEAAALHSNRDLVSHVVAALSRETSQQSLHEHAIDALLASLGLDRASLLLFDRKDVCRFVASRGLSERYRKAVDGHSPWTPSDLDATPFQVPDVTTEPSLARYLDVIRAEGIGAMLFLPLVGRHRVWGKFMLYSAESRRFDAAEIDFAQMIVREIAAGLDWRQQDRDLQEERRLFAAGPTVVFKWRNAPDWPVEYVSENVRAVLGHAPLALTSGELPYASLVHPDDLARVAGEVAEHAAAQVPWFEQEYRLRHADGSWRVVQDHTAVVRDDAGAITHFHGYLLDVTERRAAEAQHAQIAEQARHTQKLESLGILAGGIAHDFNNLLVGVLGNASLARDQVAADSPIAPLLEDIEATARRAADLTRQLLAYSGKGKFVIEPIDLSALVREMTRLLLAVISKKANVHTELREDLPRIPADATQVRQVVMNLITNASDALGETRGTIGIRTRRMHATRAWLADAQVGGDAAEGEYIVLEVADTGPGIPPGDLARLFDPFFSTKGVGRGLGLAAVLGIVRGHRGAVRVASKPGTGTTVSVLFPVAVEPIASAGHDGQAGTGRGRILVVDDDAAALAVAERVLVGHGYQVLRASDGRSALEMFAEHGPTIDLVLLDLTMPELSGWEVLQEIRRLDPEALVAVMSGYAHEAGGTAARAASAFLPKPYSATDLRNVVDRLVGSTR